MPLYAALIYDDAANESEEIPPEAWQDVMDAYNAFGEKAGAAGVIAGGEALEPTRTAKTIHKPDGKDGQLVVADGPFAETKEVLGGFYLLNCADLDEAIEWAAQIPGAWLGRIEVRPCIDFGQDEG